MNLPSDSKARKDTPIFSGVLKYFPLALAEVAKLSLIGNDKHNPGEPLHWSKGKSTDHGDCIVRHQIDVGTIDPDTITERFPKGLLHDVHVAWRALAQLQVALEKQEFVGSMPAEIYQGVTQQVAEMLAVPAIPPAPIPFPPAANSDAYWSRIRQQIASNPPAKSGIGVSWGDGSFPATETI